MAEAHEGTYELLRTTAIALFVKDGYEQTSVNTIAQAAGLSHMTFFRHFSTKESVVVDGIFNVFDSSLATAIALQPVALPPFVRAIRGFMAVASESTVLNELNSLDFRLRMKLIVTNDSLTSAMWRAGQQTQCIVSQALSNRYTSEEKTYAAGGALLGAVIVILDEWARGDQNQKLDEMLVSGLSSLMQQY